MPTEQKNRAAKPSGAANSSGAKKSSAPKGSGSSGGKKRAESAAAAEKQRERQETMRRRQSAAIVCFALAVLFFVLIIAPGVSVRANSLLHGLFGISAIAWCFLLFYLAVLLALDDVRHPVKSSILRAVLLIELIGSFIHCVSPISKELEDQPAAFVMNLLYSRGELREGAGLLGGMLGALMTSLFGRTLSVVIIVLLAFVVVMIMTQTGLIQLFKQVSKPVKSASEKASEFAAVRARERAERAAAREAELEMLRDMEMTEHEFAKKRAASRIDVLAGSTQPTQTQQPRTRKRFWFDVPVGEDIATADDAANAEAARHPENDASCIERKNTAAAQSADPVADVLASVNADGTESAAKRGTKKSSATASDVPDDPDLAFEELLQKVAGKTKKQRETEIAMHASEFAREVDRMAEEPEEYAFPPIELLQKPESPDEGDIREELKQNAERLVETLREYGVEASVIDISRGPAVTRYELKPAPGVKISKITSLTNDIALRLAAQAIRIEAPIPGKPAIGVEIPNQTPSTVYVRELIDSDLFRGAKSPVTVCIGKDIDGNIILADLAKMPHLLIAGSTGMGKSVCINSMLISLIYKSSPEDVRLIMVDPKQVELDVYNGIPHLLVPVVCDPKKAAGALQWAVSEMDKRYSLLHENNVRNIDGYNKLAEKTEGMAKLPRIVIIIDEMADLMTTSPKEVENAIARLAAMARAAGMHMVLATQRPSVDVITGTIKNNIPSRIAFAVSSMVDSRTILDEGGADGLIGKGDMLFKPVGSKPKRIQGCYVDDEVKSIVDFIKSNGVAEYDESIAMEIERNAAGADEALGSGDEGGASEDPLFFKAIEVVLEAGQASTSMLQRRLGVGYARAGRLIDDLADKGVVGPFEGSKPRQVLISRQQYLEMSMNRDAAAQPRKAAAPEYAYAPQAQQPESQHQYETPSQPDELSHSELVFGLPQEGTEPEDDSFDAPPF